MKILLVDDDADLLAVTGFALQQAGFLVVKASDGLAALDAFEREHPHIAVLDINMPRMSGFELAQKLRERSRIPLLMLTARSEESDVVRALALGADDYLSKPFSPKILIARVKALLRRGRSGGVDDAPLVFRRVRIDPQARRVWKDATPVELTASEFDLLSALTRHHGRVLSREQLIEQVWGYNYYGDDRVVDVHIGRIRKKVEDNAATPRLMVTVRGAGYRFEDEPA